MSSPNTNAATAAGSSNGSGAAESPLPFCHAVWEDAAPGSLAARLLSSSTEELFDVPGDDGIPLDACGDATLRQTSDPHHHPSPFGSDDLQSWQAVDADQAAPVMSGKLPRLASLQSQHFQAAVESHQMGGQPLQRLLSQSSIGSNCSGPFHHAALAVHLHSETFSVDGGTSSAGPAGGQDGHSTTPTGLAAYLLSAPLEALFDVPEEEDPAALSAAGAGPDGESSASGLRLYLLAMQRGETPPLPPQHPSGMFSPNPSSSAASAAAAEMYVNYPGPIFSAPLGAVPARPKGHRHGSANGMPRHIKRVLSCNDAPPDQGLQGAYGTSAVFPNAQESYHAGSPRRGTAAAAVVDAAGAGASGVVRSRSTSSVGNGPVAPVACAGASSGWFRASGSPAGGTSSARLIAVAPSGQSSSRGKYGYASQQNQHSSQRQVPGGSCADSDPCSASSGAGCASFLRPGTGSASSSTGSDNSSGSDSGSNVSPWQMVGAAGGNASGSESYDEVSPHSGAFVRHRTTGSVEFTRSRSGNYAGAPILSPQHQHHNQLMQLQFGGASFGSSTGNGQFGAMCGGGGYSAGGSGAGGGVGAQGGSGTDRWVAPMGPVLTPIEQSPVTSDRYSPSVAAIAIANGSVSSSSQRSTPVSSAVFARVSGGADAGCSSPAVAELTPQERMLQQQLQQQMAMMMMMEGPAAAAAAAMQPSQSKERHRHQRNLSGNSPAESVTGAGGAGPAGPGSVISEADMRGLEEEMRQLEADMARLQANPARLAQMSVQDKQRVQAAAAEIGSMRACLARRSPSTLMFDSSPGARPLVGGSYHGGAGAGLALGIGGGRKGGVFVAGDVDDM
ncbi:unnamed protein product [Closterium sp. Naga37s-1]|nr:unnamed protein product [Closterium sp. Naga37s-1]